MESQQAIVCHDVRASAPRAAIRRSAWAVLLALALIACGETRPAPPSANVRIAVAPLELDDVEEVRYGIRVLSALGTVWEETGLSSTQFGDGRSALSYVGPCDVEANPHTIELTIENVRAGGVDLVDPTDWHNPAPPGTPIRRTQVQCVENADVLVEFDITVVRSARQGFFDIAVELDDIFCSAKLDCREELLHDAEGERDATVVVAFACTAGEGEQTLLYLSDLVLTCDDGDAATAPVVFTLPMAGVQPGQQGAVLGMPGGVAGVFQWAVYEGDEQLTSNGAALEKCYWNRAVGIDRAALAAAGLTTCTMTAQGTASEIPLAGGTVDGSQGAYPIVSWSVEVWNATTGLCAPNPLNGAGSGVVTSYVTPDTPLDTLMPLTGTSSCGGLDDDVVCPTPVSAGGESIAVAETDGALSVTYGNRPPAVLTLPAGYTLGDSCCADACCSGAGD